MSLVAEFYRDKTLFLTGVTGFIGKALLEKLLRSCPGIQAIYCLIRAKRSKSAQERLQGILNGPIFEKIRTKEPSFAERIHIVEGDMSQVGLGMSGTDRALLEERVHIVVHCAATIKFNEHIRYAVHCNIRGVQEIVRLCHGMQHLESFVHISTAYANCDIDVIEETVYPSTVSPHKLLNMVESFDHETLSQMTPELLGNKPNTYTLTKHLAEVLLQEEAADLPLSIVRPPIVLAAWNEPIPGWTEGWSGFNAVWVGVFKGIIQAWHINGRENLNYMPVDLVVNLVLTAGWHGKNTTAGDSPPIYHLSAGTHCEKNTWDMLLSLGMKYFNKYPLKDTFRPVAGTMTTNKWVYLWRAFIDHWLYGCFMDGLAICFRRKPRLLSLYMRHYKEKSALDYFLDHVWQWKTKNTDVLRSEMSVKDQEVFSFNPESIGWDTFWLNYFEGARLYLLREDRKDIPHSLAQLRKFQMIRLVAKCISVCVMCCWLLRKSKLVHKLLSMLLSVSFLITWK